MLILGIESATEQVGCAIGGHEGVLGLVRVSHGPAPRRDADAGHRVRCTGTTGVALDEISVVAVDVGPGLFTGLRVGLATAKAIAHALRVPMIGIPSLDLLAFPVRHSPRMIVTVIDARRGELFYAFYRQVPGGVQRLSDLQLGTADDLAGRAASPPTRSTCSSATAPCATASACPSAVAWSSPSSGWPTRRPLRSCSWPTPGRCGRSG